MGSVPNFANFVKRAAGFNRKVKLNEGENKIVVEAEDTDGALARKVLTIIYSKDAPVVEQKEIIGKLKIVEVQSTKAIGEIVEIQDGTTIDENDAVVP